MFGKTWGKVLTLLADFVFTGLFLGAALQYRSNVIADSGAGFLYFCLAGYLGILSVLPRFGTPMLNAAYLAFFLGLLNYFATSRGARLFGSHQVAFAIVASVAYAALLSAMVWLPALRKTNGFPLSPQVRLIIRRLIVATAIALQFGAGSCLAVVLAVYWTRTEGGSLELPWNSFQFAMLFVALFSGCLGFGLYLSPPTRPALSSWVKAGGIMVCVLCLSALLEFWFRQNWTLFVMSSVAFIGSSLSFCQTLVHLQTNTQ